MAKWTTERRAEHMRMIRSHRHPYISDAQYLERLKSRCIVDARGCWLYQGFIHHNGYGDMCYRGKNMKTHRIAFTCTRGPIPKGMDICHTCDVKRCCNPDHVWMGTRQDNMVDMSLKRRHPKQKKTHCLRGHEFNETNTYWISYKRTKNRACKTCQRARGLIDSGWSPDEAYAYTAKHFNSISPANTLASKAEAVKT